MLSIVRIVVALLFFEHGLSKMVGFPTGEARVLFTLSLDLRRHRIRHRRAAHGRALDPDGGLHRLRRDGLCLFHRHAPASFYPIVNRGEGAILYCFIFLYIAFAGGGPWSVDAMLRKRGG